MMQEADHAGNQATAGNTEPSPALDAVKVQPSLRAAFERDVLAGLSQDPKAIPARWLYDHEGSHLFEQITELEEYYPTRAETHILEREGREFARLAGSGRTIVEFGSGSSAKTPLLIEAIDPAAYVPIDISGEFLRQSAERLRQVFTKLPILPLEGDFMQALELPAQIGERPRLGFFPGSTIGNLVPWSAVDLLRAMKRTLGPDSLLLIGLDLIKGEAALRAAYDDEKGVTARFNLNLVERINRELGGDVPVDALRHKVIWNDAFARIEMHLETVRDIAFTVCGKRFEMRAGETIHTENSHKFDTRSANMMLLAGGWEPIARWQDSESRFSLVMARALSPRMAP